MTEINQSSFEPAPISDGIQEVGGKNYMADAKGALVPVELIKPERKLEDEQVRKIMGYALALSEQIDRFKDHCMDDLTALDALLEQQYDFVKAGNRGKGNRTYMTHDGLMKVSVQIGDFTEFGPQLQVAKGLVDECLNEWSSDSRPEIRALITRAFNTDKTGQINRQDIQMLLGLDIDDERWRRAMTAIRDAMRVVRSKEYVRFAMRPAPEAGWSSVTINLAKA